ncbi:unnamed protein product [Sphagnum troendelagicum]|uniref:Uncharacterized protein n=1 Tax=Sphagnum troendelagicum TaxID=128251 RepID=A0ABP0USH7_9BRYO
MVYLSRSQGLKSYTHPAQEPTAPAPANPGGPTHTPTPYPPPPHDYQGFASNNTSGTSQGSLKIYLRKLATCLSHSMI